MNLLAFSIEFQEKYYKKPFTDNIINICLSGFCSTKSNLEFINLRLLVPIWN